MASALVKSLTRDARQVGNPMADAFAGKGGAVFTLAFPGDGRRIAVTFAEIPGRPDVMFIRSSNGHPEAEPWGVFSAANCRAMYAKLLRSGFIKEERRG